MKKTLILFSILIFLIGFLVFLLMLSYKNVKDNNKALKYFSKGSFKAASEILNKKVKEIPNNNDILINSSGADYKLNNFDSAKSKYSKVLSSTMSTKTDKFVAYYDLGNVEFKQGNFSDAVKLYKEALKINPGDNDSKYNLEMALKKLNEKSNSQNPGKDKKQDQNKDQQNKNEQDLKKQMEQNDKKQEDNKKQQQDQKNQKSKKQEDLKKEKEDLDKKRKEISDKIKDLQDKKSQKKEKQENKNEQGKENKENSTKDKKDMPASVLLNYYNESDKNSNRPKKTFKGYQSIQMQKDW
ncbi:MAG: tetratricopeptide repeat protein [Endomicrobium sp.]|jgi:septal ring factor EnvC (AmiA/AmiB activator)|nr:tetratricopeptide repeat protein [Endomicrobium sp.]